MRKLFTRLISMYILIMVFVLQGFAQFPALGPGGDFTNHKKTDVFVLTATEKVVAGNGVIRLKEGAATLGAYQATNANVSITVKEDGSSSIAVNFTSFLAEEKAYTLEVDANFVKAADDGQANTARTWNVLVGDFTPPVLASSNPLVPANGASTGIQLTTDLTIKFNEPVQVATSGKLFIYKDNGTDHGDLYDVVDATDITGAMTNTLVINTNVDFEGLTKYYVTIPEGAIVDYNAAPWTDNKNKFAGWLTNNSWAFTTRDDVAPTAELMADNIGATSFDVFSKLNKKGKVYVLPVAKGQTPVAADFLAAPAKVATVTDAAASVKTSHTQFLNVGTGVANLVEGGEYDVWVVTENAETIDPTVSAPMKKIAVKTVDVTKPTVVANYPAIGEPAADVNTKDYIKLKLSENVKLGTGNVEVYTWDASLNHTLLVSVPVANCKVSSITSKDTLFVPVAKTLWASQGVYFVKYNEGIVTDMAGNKLAGISTTEAWKFTVKDFLPPTYTIVPANGAQNASQVAPQITITFNETLYSNATGTPMVAGDIPGAVTLKKGTTAVTYTVTSFDGKVIKLTIDPAAVSSAASYELSIDTKKFFDATGNVGKTVDVIAFKLKDYEGPVVTIEPLMAGASDNILIKFNEPVLDKDGNAVTNSYVGASVIFRKGTDASGALVSAAYSVAADAKSFIIDPVNDFTTPGDQYFVRLGDGAVKDAAGNPNVATQQLVTVKDFIPPTATFSGIGSSPVDPAVVAPVITFSEPVQNLDGSPVGGVATSLVTVKEDGENMTFSASWDLAVPSTPKIVITAVYSPNKSYSISVGKSLKDLAGNAFAGVATTFTTMSNVAPALVSVSPANNAVEQANNVPLVVTFDQPVVTGTGAVTFTGTSAAVGAVSINGAVVTIGHASFVNDETITVNVPAGFVKGVNNINAPAVSWTFKTHETVKPAITVYSPVVGGIGVALDAKFKLTYSEKIVLKVGTLYIKDFSSDVTVQTLTEANCVVKNDTELEITPVAALDYNKKYYVVITEGLVEDVNGNKAVAIANNFWNFTTVANPGAFTVASSEPKDGADKVAAGINPLKVVFNRDIKTGSASASAKITLFNVTDGLIVIEDAANTGRFSYAGNTLSINTASDVVANKTYTLTIEGGIVTDNWGTPNTSKVITFYTFDNNGPKVASHTPAKDATNIPKTTTIIVTWDETPLLASDGSAISAAAIKANSLVTVNGTNAYTASVNGLQWTLTLDAALAENVVVPVVVKQTMVKDAGGKIQPADYSWSFTTEDRTCLPPSNFVVTENTKGNEIKFTVDFSEKGKVYYKMLPAADAAPSAADLIATGTMIEFTAAGTSAAKTVTGLTSGAAYKAYFVAVDASVNANQSTIYAPAQVTTIDVVPPIVTAMAPMNGATDVAANTTLKLTFDEKVVIGAGSVIIREVATGIMVGTPVVIGAGNTVIDATGKIATITTGITLASKTAYYVEVDGGTFVDLSANPMAPVSGVTTWAFTTKDTVKPLLVKTLPDYAAATTPLIIKGTAIWAEFNEALKVPTGVLYVRYMSNGNVFEVVNGGELTMSADAKTFSFVMKNVPSEQTEFYVDLSELGLKDLADNTWDNILGTTWNFIIKDQTPPAISTIVPANNATGVVIGTNVVITFTEGIFKAPDATAFTATTIKDVIKLKDPAGTSIAYTASLTTVNPDNGVVTVTLDPTNDLKSETKYTVTISPVVDILKNVSGEMTSAFTTKDMTAPYVTIWKPAFDTKANPKTGVVTVTFNEPVYDDVLWTSEGNRVLVPVLPENIPDFFTYNVGTIGRNAAGKINAWTPGTAVGFTGTISADYKVMTLTPVATALPLGSEAWYGVFLKPGVVEDIAENENEVDTTIFQIEDTQKPWVVAYGYAPVGPTAADAAMTITFNEKVKVGTGNVYIRNYKNGEVLETIAISASTATVDAAGTKVTITHADFAEATDFYVTADAGVFTDASTNLNKWDGIAIDAIETWRFSTADAVPPVTITGGLYPMPGATNVALNTRIEITFDKQIQLNTDMVTRWVVIYNEDWTPAQVIEVNAANIELKPVTTPVYMMDRVFSIKHMPLQPNKKYYVRVMEGSAIDMAGNKFAGIMDDSWHFSTEDSGAPLVVSLNPADNSTAVDNKTNLVMTFNRNVLANAAGKIKLYKEQQPGSLGTLIETIDPTSASVTIVDKVATIVLANNLEYETGYYVIVEPGAFTNTAAEKLPFAGITTTQGWNFKVEKLSCTPVNFTVTEVEQMECSALVNITVDPAVTDYVLTLNGDTVMAGDHVLLAGSYKAVVYSAEGDCKDEKMFDVGSDPVVREETVEAYLGEPVHYMDEESGIDTMLTVGVHTMTYDFEGCPRTLIVTVVEEIRTPKIAEIQGEGDKSPLEGLLVKVTATVTAVAPGEGFFMQDANAAWSGIWVEFSKASYEGIQIGNGVQVIGTVAEVANVTSIVDATMEFVPPVVEITTMMLPSPSALEAEMYESVLVKVEGAKATAPAVGTGEWTIYYEESDNAIVNDWLYDAAVVEGHYYDVTGIVNGRLDNFKLEPRIESDVKDLTLTPIEEVEANAFKVYPNPFNEKITIDNSAKLSRVVISNIAGQRVIDIEYPTREIRTANLVSGIYVISLYTENGVVKTERMIKR